MEFGLAKISPLALCAVLAGVAVTVGCTGTSGVVVDPSKTAIVVTDEGDREAAEELQRHLALISGRDITISTQAAEGAYVFSFGGPLPDANPEAVEWTVTSSGVIFRGNAYFAVVDFLENALGVRWPEGDLISYNAQNPIRISELHRAWTPELRLRVIRAELTNRVNQVFRRRMRTGSHDAPKYGHAFTKYWTLYGAKHPEWFAMREDGLRGPVGATPKELAGDVAVYAANKKNRVAICCASTGLVAQVVANWRAEGSPAYLNICENDVFGKASCHCLACRALDVVPDKADPNWEKHYADRYVHFGNAVLKLARETRPDVKVCYYAYNATQEAPGRERSLEGTVIGLVPTIFTDESIRSYVESWKRAGATEFFYRPNQHHYFNCPFLPIGSEEHFYEILQYLISRGTIGFDYDAHAAVEGGFEWFERYVLFHAMQDPSKPFSHWEDHFCSAYGAAAADVKEYFRYWRNEVWAMRLEPNLDEIIRKGKFFNFGRGLLKNLKDYYKADDFSRAGRFLEAAKTRNLAPVHRELVDRLCVAHEHARLFYTAVADLSKENTRKLVDFRKAHGFPLYPWYEQYFGDVAGIKRFSD